MHAYLDSMTVTTEGNGGAETGDTGAHDDDIHGDDGERIHR